VEVEGDKGFMMIFSLLPKVTDLKYPEKTCPMTIYKIFIIWSGHQARTGR